MIRVLSGCTSRANVFSRSLSAVRNRHASSRYWKPTTVSSAYLTTTILPLAWRWRHWADHGGEHRHARQHRRMIDGVEALGDVGIEHPLAAALAGERDMDGLDRVHRASPWSE